MSTKNDDFSAILKSNGYSMTKARREVFSTISSNSSLSMPELVQACHDSNRASVYRAVDLFEKLHIARRVYHGWKYRIELSEIFDHHHHATCEVCNESITLIEDRSLEEALRLVAAKNNFDMHTHQIEITGICQNCQNLKRNLKKSQGERDKSRSLNI